MVETSRPSPWTLVVALLMVALTGCADGRSSADLGALEALPILETHVAGGQRLAGPKGLTASDGFGALPGGGTDATVSWSSPDSALSTAQFYAKELQQQGWTEIGARCLEPTSTGQYQKLFVVSAHHGTLSSGSVAWVDVEIALDDGAVTAAVLLSALDPGDVPASPDDTSCIEG